MSQVYGRDTRVSSSSVYFHIRSQAHCFYQAIFFIQVVRGQTANVLGSLDILGNPMGLIHDVSTGVEGLVKRGNLGGLLSNVAHGLSDTAAKVGKIS